MVSIARRILFHDRVRFCVAIVGVQFAVVLITIQVGVFLKFLANTSVIIDRTEGDIWVTAKNLQNFDFGRPISERKIYQARRVNGVLWAEPLLLGFMDWKTPDGGQESVQLVGFNPDTRVGAPPHVGAAVLEELKQSRAVVIDEAERQKLGNLRVGDETEINRLRVRLSGFTRGTRSFIGSPYVFASFKNAVALSSRRKGETVFVVVKVAAGQAVEDVRDRLRRELRDVDVYTKGEFSAKTRRYWMVTTGAGVALLGSALMGFAIGAVIVGQTLYTSTLEHSREFGTLKAMGAENRTVYRIIVEQALITAAVGYALGMATSQLATRVLGPGALEVHLPWPVIASIFFVTAGMCVGASILSILRVTRIDPALVFRG